MIIVAIVIAMVCEGNSIENFIAGAIAIVGVIVIVIITRAVRAVRAMRAMRAMMIGIGGRK